MLARGCRSSFLKLHWPFLAVAFPMEKTWFQSPENPQHIPQKSVAEAWAGRNGHHCVSETWHVPNLQKPFGWFLLHGMVRILRFAHFPLMQQYLFFKLTTIIMANDPFPIILNNPLTGPRKLINPVYQTMVLRGIPLHNSHLAKKVGVPITALDFKMI